MTRFDKRYASRLLGALPLALMLPILQPASGQVLRHALPNSPAGVSRTVTLTDANNGHNVALHPGDSLIVRLPAHTDGGYTWHVVWAASQDLLTLRSDSYDPPHLKPGMMGGSGTRAFRFTVRPTSQPSAHLAEWLRFLELRPFEKGVATTDLYQVHVTISPRASATPAKKP